MTEKQDNAIPIKFYVEQMFKQIENRIEAEHRWMDQVKSQREGEKIHTDEKIADLKNMVERNNGLQRKMDKQTETFITRFEYEEKHKPINDFMIGMKATASLKSVLIAYIISIISLIISIALHFVK